MAALAALGVAANIMQIVGLSWELIQVVAEIRKTGSSAQHDEFRRTATELKKIYSKLTTSRSPDASRTTVISDDDDLNKLAEPILPIADKLLKLLDECRPTGRRTSWESLKRGVETLWSQKRISEYDGQLKTSRDLFQERISIDTNKRIELLSLSEDARYHSIKGSLRSIDEANLEYQARQNIRWQSFNSTIPLIRDAISDFQTQLKIQTAELRQRHDQSETAVLKRQQESDEAAVKRQKESDEAAAKRQQESDAAAGQRHNDILATIKNSPILSSVVITSGQEEVCNPEDPRKVQKKILSRLNFRHRRDRHEEIAQAHKKTFEWLYDDSKMSESSWANFPEWLRRGSGIYWINGKAGCGKSTLMKYIDGEHRTEAALSIWGKARKKWPVVRASYYFWNSGAEEQKSRVGLLRSLLYQILEKQPDLIRLGFPEVFEIEDFNFADFPSYIELKRALENVITQREKPINLFLVIDGLDEYGTNGTGEGIEMADIAEDLKSLAANRHVKILLSSRPLRAFQEAFEESPKLRLQDLTYEDIKTVVTDKLEKHRRIQQLQEEDENGVSSSMSKIIDSANGVFLWVALVIKNLLEGLRNLDKISELNKRLDELPKDLDDYYKHMWRKVEPRYHEEASKLLQLVMTGQKDALTLFLAVRSTEDAIKEPIKPFDDISQKLKDFEGRLNHVCFGLLEIRRGDPMSDWDVSEWHVNFLHKSAKDFLEQPQIWNEILAKTKRSEFDVNVSLLSSYLLQIKAWRMPPDELDANGTSSVFTSLWELLNDVMNFAHLSASSTGKSQDKLLHEVDRVVQYHADTVIASEIEKHRDRQISVSSNKYRVLSACRNVCWLALYLEDLDTLYGTEDEKKALQSLMETKVTDRPIVERLSKLLIDKGGQEVDVMVG